MTMFFRWVQTVRTPAVCLRVPNHLVTLNLVPSLEISTSMWSKDLERVPRGPLMITCLFFTVPVTKTEENLQEIENCPQKR